MNSGFPELDITRAKFICMNKKNDLVRRNYVFALHVRKEMSSIPKTIWNIEDGRQLIRSSGSIGANYLEAQEAISTKDFKYRIKICRKEARESKYWLNLLWEMNQENRSLQILLKESEELVRIYASIAIKLDRAA